MKSGTLILTYIIGGPWAVAGIYAVKGAAWAAAIAYEETVDFISDIKNMTPRQRKNAAAGIVTAGLALGLVSDNGAKKVANEFHSTHQTLMQVTDSRPLLRQTFPGFEGTKTQDNFCQFTAPLDPASSIAGTYNVMKVNLSQGWVEFGQNFGNPAKKYAPNYKVTAVVIHPDSAIDEAGNLARKDLLNSAQRATTACRVAG